MLEVDHYLKYFAHAIWKGHQPTSKSSHHANDKDHTVDKFAQDFIAALRNQNPEDYQKVPREMVVKALTSSIDYSLHGDSREFLFDLDTGKLVPHNFPGSKKCSPHPLYELVRAELQKNTPFIDMHNVLHHAHNMGESTHQLLCQKAVAHQTRPEYPKPKIKGWDMIKGFFLSSPLLVVIVPLITLFFAWWLLPICIGAYSALTYQMTNEMAISRYLQKHKDWLKHLLPTDVKIRNEAIKPLLIELGLTFACIGLGIWITFSFASGVGAIAAVYPACHLLGRLNSFSERHLSGHMIQEKILTETKRYPLTRLGIPVGIGFGLMAIGVITPPGLIASSAIVATALVVILGVSIFMMIHNQHRMKSSLEAVANHANKLIDNREIIVPAPQNKQAQDNTQNNEDKPKYLFNLRQALRVTADTTRDELNDVLNDKDIVYDKPLDLYTKREEDYTRKPMKLIG